MLSTLIIILIILSVSMLYVAWFIVSYIFYIFMYILGTYLPRIGCTKWSYRLPDLSLKTRIFGKNIEKKGMRDIVIPIVLHVLGITGWILFFTGIIY